MARFSFPILDIPPTQTKFLERLKDDYIVREPKKAVPEKGEPAAAPSNGHSNTANSPAPRDEQPRVVEPGGRKAEAKPQEQQAAFEFKQGI